MRLTQMTYFQKIIMEEINCLKTHDSPQGIVIFAVVTVTAFWGVNRMSVWARCLGSTTLFGFYYTGVVVLCFATGLETLVCAIKV